ncbi:MAG: hypothetical protein ACP5MH_00775 [Thermoproteus sp.]
MTAVPFYDIGEALVDGYFADKISAKHERVLLVVSRSATAQPGGPCVEPLPYRTVVELLREGYEEARRILAGAPLRRRGRLYLALIPLYSSGRYLSEIADYLTDLTATRILADLYERVLARLSEGPRDVLCAPIEVRGDIVYLGGEANRTYTYLFRKDGRFREALLSLLEPRDAGGSVDV